MRLKSLYIKDYKNIHEQTFDFSSHNGLTLLIGNNGSGKSNFLEVVSDIFSNLYLGQSNFKTKGFEIKYEDYSKNVYSVKYDSRTLEKKVNGQIENATNKVNLPKRLVAVYSGETTRLWETFYEPIYAQFIQQIVNRSSSGFLYLPVMFYLNHYYWGLALLSLLCSEADDIKKFCQNELNISENISFEFDYGNRTKYRKYADSRILEFVKAIDSKKQYLINEFIECVENAGFQRDEIFQLLYCAFTPKDEKIITKIDVKFNGISVAELSEGLKKRILIRAALEYAGQEDSVYLLDEPDAHVHLSKKKRIIEDLELYRAIKHFVITTHSPTMYKYVGKENPHSVILIENGKVKNIEDFFEVGKTLSGDEEVFNLLFSTKHIVLTEGKTDCQYIKKAIELYKESYPELYNNVDFVSVGGTDGSVVEDLLSKITDISNRKIIILVDRDNGGLKCAQKVLNNKNLKKADISTRPVDCKQNTFLMMIPTKGVNDSDFVVEDYFNHNKIRSLSIKYIREKFREKNFTGFPKVKDDLKKIVLPAFCEESNNLNDFKGFKRILNQLNSLLNQN